jgi:hypothetical protein
MTCTRYSANEASPALGAYALHCRLRGAVVGDTDSVVDGVEVKNLHCLHCPECDALIVTVKIDDLWIFPALATDCTYPDGTHPVVGTLVQFVCGKCLRKINSLEEFKNHLRDT